MKEQVNKWLNHIDSAKKKNKDWLNNVSDYENIYSCGSVEDKKNNKVKRYNILFSNTQLLFSALLTALPRFVVRKRSAKDSMNMPKQERIFYSTVVDIVKKAVESSVSGDEIKKVLEGFKLDLLLSGRGVLWCVFDAKYENLPDGQTVLTAERINVEHVYYRDFLMSEGRTWRQVWWIARRHKMTEEDLLKQFPKAKLIKLQNGHYDQNEDEQKEFIDVWEIWDKSVKKVYFVSDRCAQTLKEEDDPYSIEGFFPTPEPLRFISNNRNLAATPEYELYKEEAQDLSVCSERIAKLIKSIKARALYSAANRDIIDNLKTADDNEYVGVAVSAQINEQGIDKLFSYDPIEMKQRVAQGLYQQQQNLVDNIYEVTGISDIMRSVSDAHETAEAVNKKSKFGSLRLGGRQDKINDYIESLYKIICALICELFTAQTLAQITGVKLPAQEDKIKFTQMLEQKRQLTEQAKSLNQPLNLPPLNPKTKEYYSMPSWDQVKAYLEDNKLRDYLFSVESDSAIFEDQSQRFAMRTGLINFMMTTLQTQLPFMAHNPEFAPCLIKLTMFALQGADVPIELQTEIEQSLDGLLQKIKQPHPQQLPADQLLAQAEMLKAQAEMMKAQVRAKEVELKAAKNEKELNLESVKAASDIKIKQQQNVIKAVSIK